MGRQFTPRPEIGDTLPVRGENEKITQKEPPHPRKSITGGSHVNTELGSMFASIDPVASSRMKGELRRSSWELGFNTFQWPKTAVLSLESFETHSGGDREGGSMASASRIETLSVKSSGGDQSSG